jgi:copper transport protein
VLACGLALGLGFAPVAALAHAAQLDSIPRAEQRFSAAPAEVSVTFSENIGPIFFRVLDRNGREVGSPRDIRVEGARMILPLGASLPDGEYVMSYRVISEDTHPIGATIPFSVGAASSRGATMLAIASSPDSIWTIPAAVNRWVLYSAMLLAVGSALFVLLLNAPTQVAQVALRQGFWTAIVAAVSYVLAIGLNGAEMALAGAGALVQPGAWKAGLASTLLPSALIGVPAMVLLAWAARHGAALVKSNMLGAGAALAIGSFLVTGHAATAAPVWLMATAVGLHITAAALWFGALWPLARGAQLLDAREASGVLTAFSGRAAWAVGLIVISGSVITWTQVESIDNLVNTVYGQRLILKLVLFGILLLLAAANKRWLTPALARGSAGVARRLFHTIRAELLVYLLILLAAMSLTLTPPPRALVPSGVTAAIGAATANSAGITGQLIANGYTAEYELSSARAGENTLTVTVRSPDGKIVDTLADLEVTLLLNAAGIQDIRIKASKVGSGKWHAIIKEMIIPGQWTLGIDAFVTDYDKVEFRGSVDIR